MDYSKLLKSELIEQLKKAKIEIEKYKKMEDKYNICKSAVKEQTDAFNKAQVSKQEITKLQAALEQVKTSYAQREANLKTHYEGQLHEQNSVIIDLFELVNHEQGSKDLYYKKYRKVFLKEE